ncbi:MAG: YdcF family protein [Clostridia bacterium]
MINDLNILAQFCGVRDFDIFDKEKRLKAFDCDKADIMVLFGGSILCGGDILAKAINENIAKKYIIVGGAGHTTNNLREQMANLFKDLDTTNMQESELFRHYIKTLYSVDVDYIETKSTNCGNNITFLTNLIEKENLQCDNIILSQDASMQKRMWAVLKKYKPNLNIINYCTYSVEFVNENKIVTFDNLPKGMWSVEHYSTLLMGEIPRLKDDENGYGPKGAGYISHVEIPNKVLQAFERIKTKNEKLIRTANPKYKK